MPCAGENPATVLEGPHLQTNLRFSLKKRVYNLEGGFDDPKPDTLAMVANPMGHRLALAETDHKLAGLNCEVKF